MNFFNYYCNERNLDSVEHIQQNMSILYLHDTYSQRDVFTMVSHRKLSSLATNENPLKALLELVLALSSGVRLTELGTNSLVNSGSIC